MSDPSRLVALLAQRSAKLGHFTLSSGKQSNFYIDARLTTMSPDGLSIIGSIALSALRKADWDIAAIGGLTLGADPISYAISYASAGSDHPLRAFTVRKEPKSHGTEKLIEGPLNPGDRAAVIEDVITSGRSALRAIAALRNADVLVAGVLALVDREEGGRETIEASGVSVISLTNATEIMDALRI
jgi:orotate phosphoribosyltransferase